MARYLLLLFFTGCSLAKMPAEVAQHHLTLQHVELKYRNGGDVAFLYWYDDACGQMYLQAIPAQDTVTYRQGMHMIAFINR